MKLNLDSSTAKYVINAYDTGMITVNNQVYMQNMIVTSNQIIDHWEPGHVEQINENHIHHLIGLKPEIILLGTGKNLTFPHPKLISIAMQQGIGFEVMDTGSACRTYNILSAEDRNIAAALIML